MMKYSMSELMKGADAADEGSYVGDVCGFCTLQRRKSGMKTVRRRENVQSFRGFQHANRGIEQRCRPRRSPMLNKRKWIELKSSGLNEGFVGSIDEVMGGKTA